MIKFLHTINQIVVLALAVVLFAVSWSSVAEAATKKVKCSKDDLQKEIDSAVNGDTIELTGICLGNFRIDGKDLTLLGASTTGPHGIQGTDAEGSALFISRSNNTVLQNLSFSNGAGGGGQCTVFGRVDDRLPGQQQCGQGH